MGLSGRRFFAWDDTCRHRPLFHRKQGFSGQPVQHEYKTGLRDLGYGGDILPIPSNSDQHRLSR